MGLLLRVCTRTGQSYENKEIEIKKRELFLKKKEKENTHTVNKRCVCPKTSFLFQEESVNQRCRFLRKCRLHTVTITKTTSRHLVISFNQYAFQILSGKTIIYIIKIGKTNQ